MSLRINEIFYSIQGESSFAGRPCVFIRLTGCNLRCTYCDTTYAYDEGVWWETPDILEIIHRFKCPLVEITGGEPLLQKGTPALARQLLDEGFTVLLETNGSLDIRLVNEQCVRIMDVKCPSSGEADKNCFDNLRYLTGRDEIKFVIADRSDYEYAKGILSSSEVLCRCKPPLFSAAHGRLAPDILARWMLEDHFDAHLQIQLHKIIWGAEKRGV